MDKTADQFPVRWWHLPEARTIWMVILFVTIVAGLRFVFPAEDSNFPPLVAFAIAALLGMGAARTATYATADKQMPFYNAFYLGVSFGLAMMLIEVNGVYSVLGFTAQFLFLSTFYGLGMHIMIKPRPVPAMWFAIYQAQSVFGQGGFAAQRARVWPYLTVCAIFAVLFLSQNPVWAVWAGASCYMFTPYAFVRNPATARPVLVRIFNLLAVCLMFFAAASLIWKGF